MTYDLQHGTRVASRQTSPRTIKRRHLLPWPIRSEGGPLWTNRRTDYRRRWPIRSRGRIHLGSLFFDHRCSTHCPAPVLRHLLVYGHWNTCMGQGRTGGRVSVCQIGGRGYEGGGYGGWGHISTQCQGRPCHTGYIPCCAWHAFSNLDRATWYKPNFNKD